MKISSGDIKAEKKLIKEIGYDLSIPPNIKKYFH